MGLIGCLFEAVLMRFDEGKLLSFAFSPPKKKYPLPIEKNLIGNSVPDACQMPSNT